MNYEQALHIKPKVERFDFEADTLTLTVQKEWLDVVISALEKQVQKKPTKTNFGSNGECPICGADLDIETAKEELKPKFCWNCGQALKWSDEK